ncbi:MAG: tetratricopeptide repeat protein [Granulosicoccaceae bacterium]
MRSIAALLAVAICAGLYVFYAPSRPQNAVAAMTTGNYDIAAEYYTQAVNEGDQRASNSLGNLYYLGLGIERNYQRASELYFESASAGIADAQLNLGHMFKLGLGVDTDPMRAFAWYNMADIHGSPAAELYMSQIAREWTLSPMQISTALSKWSKLEFLVDEGL